MKIESDRMIIFDWLCEKMKKIFHNTWEIPTFLADEKKRYCVIFSGVVQGVGFRYETWTIAKKLGVTGWVENLSNGDVYLEIQGEENKLQYLINCLKTNRRFYVQNVKIEEMELVEDKEFVLAN